MKKRQRSWLISLTAVIPLLFASVLCAQETDATTPSEPAPVALATVDTNASAVVATNEPEAQREEPDWTRPRQVVMTGQSVEVKVGETVQEVVVIGGKATIHGKVLGDAVVIGGNLELGGEVGGDTVAVLGSVTLQPGAVAHKDAVAVLGSLTIPDGATVGHDAVSVAGTLDIAPGAVVRGDRVNVGLPAIFPKMEWLGKWISQCVFKLRPLAPQVGWIWAVAGMFFLLSLLIAAVFPRPVQACVETLNKRPATTFLLGLLTQLMAPIVILILIATGIGIAVVPFVGMALFIGTRVGKVALLEWIGFRLGGHFGGVFQKPLIAFLIGSILVTLLYLVPVLGLLLFMLLSVWGLGAAVTASFSSTRREMPQKPAPPQPLAGPPTGGQPAPATALAPMPSATAPPFTSSFAAVAPSPGLSAGPAEPPTPASAPPPGVPPAPAAAAAPPIRQQALSQLLALPRAGLWERMGAGFIDFVIVGILSVFVGGLPLGFLIALAYFSAMWAWKGSTLGAIVLRLQVVRSDGSPLTFPVALVRALAAALSIVVFFLGFLWIAWDQDKEGWHDKIAGTGVVRLPRSIPLVCV